MKQILIVLLVCCGFLAHGQTSSADAQARSVSAQALTKANALSILIGGTVDQVVTTNANAMTVVNSSISSVNISFVTSSTLSFNSFSFPGQNFTNASSAYAFCYLTASGGVKDTSFIAFDKRTTSYVFRLKRTYALTEGVTVAFGYCTSNFQIFANGSSLLMASSVTDPLISLSPLRYINPGSTIYSGSTSIASSSWVAARYSLLNTIPILQALGTGGSSSTPSPTTAVQPSTQPFNFVLPPKLYWIANNPMWLYPNTTIYNNNIAERRQVDFAPITAKNGAGTTVTPYLQYPDRAIITPTESVSLTFSLRDYSLVDSLTTSVAKTVLSKTYSLSVVTKPTSKTINTVVIADSYFDLQWGSGIYAYLSAMATADGNTINFKGTRTSYGFQGEARASWGESTFFRYVPTPFRTGVTDPTSVSMSSPFMFSTDNTVGNAMFDFGQYLSTNSIGTVDQVVIFLGKNGGDGAQINLMITSIKAALPSVKIIVSYVTPIPANRFNWDPASQKATDNQNLSYNGKFAGRESAGIYLCPASISFPRLYGHNGSNTDPVQFNLNSIPQSYQDTDHHPNGTGAKAIAWSMYNYMLYASMFSLTWWQLFLLLNILAGMIYRTFQRVESKEGHNIRHERRNGCTVTAFVGSYNQLFILVTLLKKGGVAFIVNLLIISRSYNEQRNIEGVGRKFNRVVKPGLFFVIRCIGYAVRLVNILRKFLISITGVQVTGGHIQKSRCNIWDSFLSNGEQCFKPAHAIADQNNIANPVLLLCPIIGRYVSIKTLLTSPRRRIMTICRRKNDIPSPKQRISNQASIRVRVAQGKEILITGRTMKAEGYRQLIG